MSSKNDSRDTPGIQSKADPTCRGRDAREGVHDDGSTDSKKEASEPPHGHISHGTGRFLWHVPPETPLDDLADAYDRWQATDDPEQSDISGWSE